MAKDFAHEYERMINGKAFVGVAIYNDHRDGLDSQESQKDRIVSELRSAGFTARVFSGIYGSRYYGTAISGWLVMIEKKKYTQAECELLDELAVREDW